MCMTMRAEVTTAPKRVKYFKVSKVRVRWAFRLDRESVVAAATTAPLPGRNTGGRTTPWLYFGLEDGSKPATVTIHA